MLIQVAVFVFLFLARIRFPKSKSITEVIRSRYSENTVKRIRKCDDNNAIPNFLNFCLANGHLKYSSTYRLCQLNLLRKEIRRKHSTIRNLQKEFISLEVSLQNELNLIDFAHVSTLFFGINDKILKSKSSVQQKKFYKLLQESKTGNDPEKYILNFCTFRD